VNSHNLAPREVPKHIVVITDGVTNGGRSVAEAIRLVRQNKMYTFAVGITTKDDVIKQLLEIANQVMERVFLINNYNGLRVRLLELSKAICKASKSYYDTRQNVGI